MALWSQTYQLVANPWVFRCPLSVATGERDTGNGEKETRLADYLERRSAIGTARSQHIEHSRTRLSELSATLLIQGAAPLQLYYPVLSGERLACREAQRSQPSLCCCGYSMPGHSQLIPVGANPAAGCLSLLAVSSFQRIRA